LIFLLSNLFILAQNLKMKSKTHTLIAFLYLVFSLSFSFAQTKEKASKPAKVEKSRQVKVKKDGTPDRRYKENKASAKPAPSGPTKKDGTPDMRYKENKKADKKPEKK
jgi:hypothetical protein